MFMQQYGAHLIAEWHRSREESVVEAIPLPNDYGFFIFKSYWTGLI